MVRTAANPHVIARIGKNPENRPLIRSRAILVLPRSILPPYTNLLRFQK